MREEFPSRSLSQQRLVYSDDPELQIYDPWGKQGAGAPMRDKDGNIQTSVFGRMKNEVYFAPVNRVNIRKLINQRSV